MSTTVKELSSNYDMEPYAIASALDLGQWGVDASDDTEVDEDFAHEVLDLMTRQASVYNDGHHS